MRNFGKYFLILAVGLALGLEGFFLFSKSQLYRNLTRGELNIGKTRSQSVMEELSREEVEIIKKSLSLMTKIARDPDEIIQEALPIVYYTDRDVGPMLLPHTKIHYHTPYFDTTIITNSEGFTGRDFHLETDNYRIAILGDSSVEAYGVADTSRFPHLTEMRVFQKTDGRLKVEVMGFGVSGWGTVHHYGAIRKYVLKYKPDEIWLMFLPTNDLGDNTPFMNGPPNGPTFVYKNKDSDEIIDIKFGYTDIPNALTERRNLRYGKEKLQDTWGNWTNGLLPYYWSPERNPQWDMIMDHTFQTLGLIKELCDRNNIKLSLVYRASGYDQSESNFDQLKAQTRVFLKKNLPMEQTLGMTRFRERIRNMGIGFINTLNMKEQGIVTKADEFQVKKHLIMAEFFSNIIIDKQGKMN